MTKIEQEFQTLNCLMAKFTEAIKTISTANAKLEKSIDELVRILKELDEKEGEEE